MSLLSIIVPIYNGELYISKCFDSILNQSFSDFELICVNDGSIDSSLKICEDYAKRDNRFRILNKKRGGVASARGTGLKYATGEYITFVDSDDWIEKDMYSKMMQKIQMGIDMVICNFLKDSDIDSIKMNNNSQILNRILSRDEIINYAFEREKYRGFTAYLWNKIIRRECISDTAAAVFDSGLKRGDDVAFFTAVAMRVKGAAYINDCLYHYIQRSTSITHTVSASNLENQQDILKGYEFAIKLLGENNISPNITIWLKRFYCYHASVLAETAIELNDNLKLKSYQKALRLYYEEYCKTNIGNEMRLTRIEQLLKADIEKSLYKNHFF